MLMRAVAVILVCALPTPLLAQSGVSLRIPRQIDWAANQSAAKPKAKDSLKNGAIIGAVVLGAWCAIICGQGLDNAGKLPLAVLVAAGEGAAIGAGIDAMHSRKTGIYFRRRW
jgi:hypothetical protein